MEKIKIKTMFLPHEVPGGLMKFPGTLHLSELCALKHVYSAVAELFFQNISSPKGFFYIISDGESVGVGVYHTNEFKEV